MSPPPEQQSAPTPAPGSDPGSNPENRSGGGGEASASRVVELVVNLDDTTGELIGHATQTLLDEGALDVWTTPIQMKKQRPGVMLCVLTPPEVAQAMAKRILQLTGSFGVRFREWDRLVLDREHVTAPTRLGNVSLKLGRLDGQLITAQPEFDSVRALAESSGASSGKNSGGVRQAMDAARAVADAFLQQQTYEANSEGDSGANSGGTP